jgi:hypothetical protein
MKIKVDQNEIVTRKILSEEMIKLEEKMDKRFSHHFGLAMEFMEDKFKLVMEGVAGVPSDVVILKDKALINEKEHSEFKTKINILSTR